MKTETWNEDKSRFVEVNDEWWAVAKDVTEAVQLMTMKENMVYSFRSVKNL